MSVLGIDGKRSCSLLLLIACFIACFTAPVGSISAGMASQALNSPSGALLIDVEAGRLDATILGRPTREVLEAVSGATGIRFFVEPSLLAIPLSARVENLSLEDGLKRILGVHSYVMLFSAQLDRAGRHRLKAVRVYPKGRFSAERYVLVQRERNETDPVDVPAVLSPQEVDALLQRHAEITRAGAAQRIAERRNGRHARNWRDDKSPARLVFERVQRVRTLQQRKARTLARRQASETQFLLEAHKKRSAALRNDHERRRRDARQSAVSRGTIR